MFDLNTMLILEHNFDGRVSYSKQMIPNDLFVHTFT